jgi:hypothetical protein
LYTYETDGTTPKAAYTDPDLSVAHANPIILDANGEALVYYSGAYKLVWDAADDINMGFVDNYELADPSASGEYGIDTGAADAYVVNGVAAESYSAGLSVKFRVGADNTGASTINVNSLGVQNIINTNGGALSAGQLLTGGAYTLLHDGTSFQLQTAKEPATQTEINTGTDASKPATANTIGRLFGSFSAVSSVDISFASTDRMVEIDLSLTSFTAGAFVRVNILEGGTPNLGAIHFGGGKDWDSAGADVSNPINGDTYIPICGVMSTTSGNTPSCRVRIFPNSGAWCVIQSQSVYTNNTTGLSSTLINGAQARSTASNRDGVRITASSGNITGSYVVRRYKQ